MIRARKRRALTLESPSARGRPPFLSAASSLVVVQSRLYVVADDELHLGVFPVRGRAPGRLVRLIKGKLPAGQKKRKRRKPDFEAQVLLPPFPDHPHGALLAIGSGSRPARRKGVLLPLDARGRVAGAPREIRLATLLSAMEVRLGELNIEGAVIAGNRLILLQRGNKGGAHNALVSMHLPKFLRAIAAAAPVDIPFRIQRIALGSIEGVPWGFTDAAALPDGSLVFTAVAEDTEDAYHDGPCLGAAIGILSDGKVKRFELLTPLIKPEGVAIHVQDGRLKVLLVTDADDAAIPAGLWEAQIE